MPDKIDELLPTAKEIQRQSALEAAEKAEQYARLQAAAEADGLRVLVAAEMEFVVFDAATGAVAGRGGPAYGLAPLLDHAGFIDDVHRSFDHAGLDIEQLHAEYGSGQIELSIAPAAPLQAADAAVLARILVCQAGRRHGLAVSFSPRPLAEGIGTGLSESVRR